MALKVPPAWTQGGTYTAQSDRLTAQGVVSGTGILGASSLAVTAQVSPNLTVNVASGWAAIVSSTAANGVYQIYNDATTVLTVSTADLTNPRIDRVVATVTDGSNTVAFSVIAGTPAGSPVAPATPSDSISLATLAVAALTTTITSANITDTRVAASSGLVSGLALPLTGGTLTGGLVLSGGSSTVAPLKLSSAAVLSAAAGGVVEYDGNVGYFTPSAGATGGRGVLPSAFYFALATDKSIGTSPTSLFGAGLTLAASTTYELEMVVFLTGLSTSNHTVVIDKTGTATFTSAYAFATSGDAGLTGKIAIGDPTTGITVQATTTSASSYFMLKGLLRVNAGGTYNPQITTTLGITPVVQKNSFIKLTPIGSSSVTSVGAWA